VPNTGKTTAIASPILVYDDACGLCGRSVQFVLPREHRHDLLFVARESELGKELRCEHALELVYACHRQYHLYRPSG